jgi:hypothetical protein
MMLARGLNTAAWSMFLVGLVFASTPFVLAGAMLAIFAAFLKGVVDE